MPWHAAVLASLPQPTLSSLRLPRPPACGWLQTWFRCWIMCMVLYFGVGAVWSYYCYYAFGAFCICCLNLSTGTARWQAADVGAAHCCG